jgi:secretion/DNA translocation related TadE-like protein
MMVVLLGITVGATCVGSAVVARHRAQAAADMAALAAATVMPAGIAEACDKASAAARVMHTVATACSAEGLDVVVSVDAPVALASWGLGPAHAVARAGPGHDGFRRRDAST